MNIQNKEVPVVKTKFQIKEFFVTVWEIFGDEYNLHQVEIEYLPNQNVLIFNTNENLEVTCGRAVCMINGIAGFDKLDVERGMWPRQTWITETDIDGEAMLRINEKDKLIASDNGKKYELINGEYVEVFAIPKQNVGE